MLCDNVQFSQCLARRTYWTHCFDTHCTLKEKEEASRMNQKRNFDKRHKVHEMKTLSSGTTVFITDMKCRGKVIQRANTPRSYMVDTPTAVVRRNRSHLRIIPDISANSQKEQSTTMLVNNRPHRIKKLSLKARENLGLK